jgi:hypothetical protein
MTHSQPAVEEVTLQDLCNNIRMRDPSADSLVKIRYLVPFLKYSDFMMFSKFLLFYPLDEVPFLAAEYQQLYVAFNHTEAATRVGIFFARTLRDIIVAGNMVKSTMPMATLLALMRYGPGTPSDNNDEPEEFVVYAPKNIPLLIITRNVWWCGTTPGLASMNTYYNEKVDGVVQIPI